MYLSSDELQAATNQIPRSSGRYFLGLAASSFPGTVTFCDTPAFVAAINGNPNVTGIFTTGDLAAEFRADIQPFVVDDARYAYYSLRNELVRRRRRPVASDIHPDARIHPSAHVAAQNVTIGAGTVIGPMVTILEDVQIGQDCIIQAGAVVGSEGFEYRRTSKGILPVIHDGRAILGDRVELGANTCVDKGFSHRDTIIQEDTKVDNLVHIGHNAHIGKRCFVAACAQIGAVNMGDDVWVGPSVNLLYGQNVGSSASITVGSLVTRDVQEGQKVTGYFAVPHEQFIEKLKEAKTPKNG